MSVLKQPDSTSENEDHVEVEDEDTVAHSTISENYGKPTKSKSVYKTFYPQSLEGKARCVFALLLILVILLVAFVPQVEFRPIVFTYLFVNLVVAPTHSLRRIKETKKSQSHGSTKSSIPQLDSKDKRAILSVGFFSSLTLVIVFILTQTGVSFGRELSGEEPHSFVKLAYGLDVLMHLTAFVLVTTDISLILFMSANSLRGYVLKRKNKRENLFTRDEKSLLWKTVIVKSVLSVLVGIILTAVSFHNATLTPEVNERHYRFKNFPSSLDGFRLVQVSDIHGGPTIGRSNVESVVEQVNTLDADAITLTGDIIDGRLSTFRAALQPLHDLHATRGVYLCTGNHEYVVSSDEVDKWMDEFKQYGIRPLRNERVAIFSKHNLTWSNREGFALYPPTASLSEDDQRLLDQMSLNSSFVEWPTQRTVPVHDEPSDLEGFYLAGIEDYMTKGDVAGVDADPERAFGSRLDNRTLIALAHQPSHIFDVAEFNPELVLSGHTHGGQIFPNHLNVRLSNPYFAGLNRHSDVTQIYVNTGTNQVGPRARLGSRREITVHILHPAESG